MLKGSDRLDEGKIGKNDEAEADQASKTEVMQEPRVMSAQAAAHLEHVPLTIAQAAIFSSPDLEPARHSIETSIRQLQNVQCTFTTITADSSQPVFVNGLTVEVGCKCSHMLFYRSSIQNTSLTSGLRSAGAEAESD